LETTLRRISEVAHASEVHKTPLVERVGLLSLIRPALGHNICQGAQAGGSNLVDVAVCTWPTHFNQGLVWILLVQTCSKMFKVI